MKLSKKLKAIFATVLMVITLFSCSISAYANPIDKYHTDDSCIDWEADKELNELIGNKPILPDKTYNSISKLSTQTGTYPKRKGVILVTNQNLVSGNNIPFVGHAAIIYNSTTVVEALSKGVTTGSNNWKDVRNQVWGVTVKGTTTTQDSNAANWCYKRIGCTYNRLYTDVENRSKFYCSQLVWASFRDLYGIDLNTSTLGKIVAPKELVSSENTSTIYYYKK